MSITGVLELPLWPLEALLVSMAGGVTEVSVCARKALSGDRLGRLGVGRWDLC